MSPSTEKEFRSKYLSGKRLYGDDFSGHELEAWYEDERSGYKDLVGSEPTVPCKSENEYRAFNYVHGYSRIDMSRVRSILAIGAFDGRELVPVVDSRHSVTIIDPAARPSQELVARAGVVKTVEPDPSGVLPLQDAGFDLVTCFGVLHHIANVSFVVKEIHRVLRSGGHALVREPIGSMGDWRSPRPGLTKRERGIPPGLLTEFLESAGFLIERQSMCFFAPLSALGRKLGRPLTSSTTMVRFDSALSTATRWNYRYHPESRLRRIRPGSVFFVATKGDHAR